MTTNTLPHPAADSSKAPRPDPAERLDADAVDLTGLGEAALERVLAVLDELLARSDL